VLRVTAKENIVSGDTRGYQGGGVPVIPSDFVYQEGFKRPNDLHHMQNMTGFLQAMRGREMPR
jgi:hypothetical protein